MTKIVILDGHAVNPGDLSWESIQDLGELEVYDRTPATQVVNRAQGAKAIYTNKVLLTKEVLVRLSELKFIGVLATGYNVVDTQVARDLGICVTNIPDYSTQSVAQMVFALLLELCNRVGDHHQAVKQGQWSSSKDFCFWNYPLIEISGKTFGVIGLGSIGKATAKIAQAFGMKVIACTPRPDRSMEAEGIRFVQLEELLINADVVSLHCPLTEMTRGMIHKENLELMKPTAFLINTARGPIVVEKDLAESLNSKKIAGAAVDVLSSEPPEFNNPLFEARNCIITPHIAWAPQETRKRLIEIAALNLKHFLAGRPINVVK